MGHEGQTGATVAKLGHRREFYHWKLTLNYYFPCRIFTSLRFDLPATSISPKQCMYVSYTIENKVLKLKKKVQAVSQKKNSTSLYPLENKAQVPSHALPDPNLPVCVPFPPCLFMNTAFPPCGSLYYSPMSPQTSRTLFLIRYSACNFSLTTHLEMFTHFSIQVHIFFSKTSPNQKFRLTFPCSHGFFVHGTTTNVFVVCNCLKFIVSNRSQAS